MKERKSLPFCYQKRRLFSIYEMLTLQMTLLESPHNHRLNINFAKIVLRFCIFFLEKYMYVCVCVRHIDQFFNSTLRCALSIHIGSVYIFFSNISIGHMIENRDPVLMFTASANSLDRRHHCSRT